MSDYALLEWRLNRVSYSIIVNNNRITHTVKTPLQQGIIAHVSKLTSGAVSNDGTIINNSITTSMPSNTMVASIQSNSGGGIQVSQGSVQNQQSSSFASQTAQQVANLSTQGGSQIITVSQQQPPQQLISNQGNIHQQGNYGCFIFHLFWYLKFEQSKIDFRVQMTNVSLSNRFSLLNFKLDSLSTLFQLNPKLISFSALFQLNLKLISLSTLFHF